MPLYFDNSGHNMLALLDDLIYLYSVHNLYHIIITMSNSYMRTMYKKYKFNEYITKSTTIDQINSLNNTILSLIIILI